MGIVPIWGYQLVTAIFVAYLLKLNKIIVAISANISIPPMIPIILFLSIKIGELVLANDLKLNIDTHISFATIKSAMLTYIVGSIVFAIFAGMVSGLLSYSLLALTRKQGKLHKSNR